jgi:hypothetical protein
VKEIDPAEERWGEGEEGELDQVGEDVVLCTDRGRQHRGHGEIM